MGMVPRRPGRIGGTFGGGTFGGGGKLTFSDPKDQGESQADANFIADVDSVT